MAKTQTQEKPAAAKTEMPQEAPEVHAVTVIPPSENSSFKKQLSDREGEYRSLLPSSIPVERFMAVAQTAVKKSPRLLECTPRSLFLAFSQAAQDGLLPDGKQGIILDHNTKVSERGKQDRWELQATWIPMAFGIRKRARETDKIIIDAQVVYANDFFDRDQGDDPKIIHKPAPLDKDQGEMIGAYAIFKYEDGQIIHRETMRKTEIEMVQSKSKSPGGMLWKDFPGEAWRKTAIRRGSKTVPVSPELERILTRDDEQFDFNQERHEAPALSPPSPPSPPSVPGAQSAPATVTSVPVESTSQQENLANQAASPSPPAPNDEYGDWKRDCYAEMGACETIQAVEDIRDRVLPDLKVEDVQPWKDACADKATELFKGKK